MARSRASSSSWCRTPDSSRRKPIGIDACRPSCHSWNSPLVSTPNAEEPCSLNVAVILVDQLVAQAEPAIAADGVEPRQQQVAGGDQLQLAPLDFPLLLRTSTRRVSASQ